MGKRITVGCIVWEEEPFETRVHSKEENSKEGLGRQQSPW